MKFAPLIVMRVALAPAVTLVGKMEVSDGTPLETVNGVALVARPFAVCTVMLPVVAFCGTLVERLVLVAPVTVAAVPLNCSVLFAGVVENAVPVMVTGVPHAPVPGETFVIVGVSAMVKFASLWSDCVVTVVEVTLIL